MKDRSNKGFALKLKRTIGILLIAVASIMIIARIGWTLHMGGGLDDSDKYSLASDVILLAGGIAVYLMKKLDTKIIIGATGLIIAVSDLVNSGQVLTSSFNIRTTTDLIIIALIVAIPLSDLFLIVFSIRYMQGHRRNAIRMAICVGIPLFVYLFIILFFLGPLFGNLESVLSVLTTNVPPAIIYGVYLWFLLLPGVREDISSWKVYKLTRDIYNAEIVDPKSTVYRKDLLELAGKMKDMDAWEDSKEFPGAKECHIDFGKDMNIRRMTFRKTADTDTVRVSIIRMDAKEYIQAVRFDFMGMVPLEGSYDDCKVVRFFGNDGFFMDVTVRDNMPEPRKTYAIDRIIDRMKFTKFNKNKD